MGNDSSRDIPPRAPSPSQHEAPSSKPVDVPAPANDSHPRYDTIHSEPAVSSAEAYYVPPSQSQFSRPPRLPLPIEEEVHTPGSPIISPADFTTPLDPIDVDGILPRRTSVLSNTTVDDDDVGDGITGLEGEPGQQAVPTLIEWIGEGEKVYVTGTFAAWDKKYRLHRGGPSPHKDALSAIIPLNPGTHHLKFIVDGDMRLSDNLPTAVDFTNILVNYIEVSPDDLPQAEDAVTPAVELPEPTPVTELKAPDGIYPPQVLPLESETQLSEPKSPMPPVSEPHPPSQVVPVAPSSPKHYHQTIPRYLADLDLPEDSSRQSRANAAVSNLPTPPSLPGFLGKSILNVPTPMKDDSSVLVMPNHTVLNHLSTSSIKNNVLATSATTRYKRKFLTTIMYKPTNAGGD
ncbi:AMPKBI-domain-containing protein [Mytilinidion resinicola]|uniref:AMPKBI-domain-containing protein n=1 Tax=Mytilinidion resinicola TaxID=574789 RepID=A0A6A6YU37_9PEZI|nr:AMPKBI-domain-containing protein [Mytilinidion resinicola]KAF2811485.1 AMPKBI-domain-containing protein [Mytilinidion resinicola]